jgi:hypothetical protein
LYCIDRFTQGTVKIGATTGLQGVNLCQGCGQIGVAIAFDDVPTPTPDAVRNDVTKRSTVAEPTPASVDVRGRVTKWTVVCVTVAVLDAITKNESNDWLYVIALEE